MNMSSDLHKTTRKGKKVMDLSWITAVAREWSNKGVVRAKIWMAILHVSKTGTALAGYGEQDREKAKVNFQLQLFACTYHHGAEGTTITNSY